VQGLFYCVKFGGEDDESHMSEGLAKETLTITYCNKCVSGNAAQNILLNKGFKKVYNISGGYKHYSKIIKC